MLDVKLLYELQDAAISLYEQGVGGPEVAKKMQDIIMGKNLGSADLVELLAQSLALRAHIKYQEDQK